MEAGRSRRDQRLQAERDSAPRRGPHKIARMPRPAELGEAVACRVQGAEVDAANPPQ